MTFTSLTPFDGGIKQFNTHAGNIYYLTYRLYGYIFDMDKKEYQTELLIDYDYREGVKCDRESIESKHCNIWSGVLNFCIDGDFIYWTMWESHEIISERGLRVGNAYYDDGIIYRTRLDSDPENNYIDFHGRTAVYKPEQGYKLGDWNIKDGYIYAVLYSENGYKTLSRVNIGSNSPTHIFW